MKDMKVRSINIDDDTWNAIVGVAKALDRKTSDYVRMILREHIEKLGKAQKNEK